MWNLIQESTRKEYINYIGSLTTPPCSEVVNWNLFDHLIPISRKQVRGELLQLSTFLLILLAWSFPVVEERRWKAFGQQFQKCSSSQLQNCQFGWKNILKDLNLFYQKLNTPIFFCLTKCTLPHSFFLPETSLVSNKIRL